MANEVITSEIKKEICQCRSCGKVFHQSKAKVIHIILYGKENEDKRCPVCNGKYGLIDFIDNKSIEGVYKTFDFYRMKKK